MTEKELRAWMRKESLADAWFVSPSEGSVDNDLLTLEQIFKRYGSDPIKGKSSVWVLHQNQQNRKDPAWIEFDLQSFDGEANATPQQAATNAAPRPARHSRSSARKKQRTRGIILQLFVLLLFIVIGGVVWYFANKEEPPSIRFISEDDAHSIMLANLQQNLILNNPNVSEQQGEPIRTVVSATQRMLMVRNSNLENWPSFRMRIIAEDGQVYQCSYDNTIPAYSTLSISMRKIVNAKGEALTRDTLKSGTTIELSIPGYKDWSSKL